MEENMLKNNVDLELILGKVQRKMTNLSINPQCSSTSRRGEILGTRRGLFYGNPPNIRNVPDLAQSNRDQEIAQLNQKLCQI